MNGRGSILIHRVGVPPRLARAYFPHSLILRAIGHRKTAQLMVKRCVGFRKRCTIRPGLVSMACPQTEDSPAHLMCGGSSKWTSDPPPPGFLCLVFLAVRPYAQPRLCSRLPSGLHNFVTPKNILGSFDFGGTRKHGNIV